MVTRNPDRVVVQFAVNFNPQIRFQQFMIEVAASAQDRLKVNHWGFGPEIYILRDTEKRFFIAFGHNRIGFLSSFMNNANLDQLVEPKLFDTGLKEFRDRIAMDCLLFDIDLSLENATLERISDFTKQSLEAADDIAEATVARLKRLPTKRDIK
jgi:hypothetical protein